MSEILDFPKLDPKRNLTAMGRFFMAVDKQNREQEEQRRLRRARSEPTPEEIAAAQRELTMIYSGENMQEAQRMYNQGKDDVVHGRKGPDQSIIVDTVTIAVESKYTTAALFYIHVERLSDIANRAYDKPRQSP